MNLSPAQILVLRSDILGDAQFNSVPTDTDGDHTIANVYNSVVSPDWWVWRTRVTKKEAVQETSPDGTTFTWAGNGYITRSSGEIACFDQVFSPDESGIPACNPSLQNVRQAFSDIFSGAGNAALNRTHLTAMMRRKATRIEKLFQVPGGLGTVAAPSTMTFEGPISDSDVRIARRG